MLLALVRLIRGFASREVVHPVLSFGVEPNSKVKSFLGKPHAVGQDIGFRQRFGFHIHLLINMERFSGTHHNIIARRWTNGNIPKNVQLVSNDCRDAMDKIAAELKKTLNPQSGLEAVKERIAIIATIGNPW